MKRLALLGFVALISGNAVFAEDQCEDQGSGASNATTQSSKEDTGAKADLHKQE